MKHGSGLLNFVTVLACSANPSGGPPAVTPDISGASSAVSDTRLQVPTTLTAVGLDPAAIQATVSPCQDFYEFACGSWIAKTEIPADYSRYGRFTEISERNESVLHDILEAARAGTLQSPVAERLAAHYGACMDEAGVERAGLQPIEPLLKVVAAVKDLQSLDSAIAAFHRQAIPALFHLGATPDFVDATKMIADLGQDGLGLPDRDYYFDAKERGKKLLAAYEEHVAALLTLSGFDPARAKLGAADVLRIETALAKASMDRAERRDPEKVYHRLERAGVEKLVPNFDWKRYFAALGFPNIEEINVDAPPFFARLASLRTEEKPVAWRNYLTWSLLRTVASTLPKRFDDEDFKLIQLLSGAKEQPVRWKRCVRATSDELGELLAQPYLERRFGPGAKSAADAMVKGISGAFEETVRGLGWMTEPTKQKALQKLAKISPLFGYPEKWKSYDWEVNPSSYAGNSLRSAAYEKARELGKVGKTYDRSEWFMTPQTTNAYYNPQANQIVFPAGILQPPFFAEKAHVPVNLGAIGMIVGHELTHGFDDSGAKFDGDGNMKNWWAKPDLEQFTARGQCVEKQYSGYEALPRLPLNGKLTLGENIADIGGVKLAYQAYHEMLAGADRHLVADGYTEDQQFFLAVGQAWCSKTRDEAARMRVTVDPHSPPEFRVNGSLRNLPEFAQAWSCKDTDAMSAKNACSVW